MTVPFDERTNYSTPPTSGAVLNAILDCAYVAVDRGSLEPSMYEAIVALITQAQPS